MRGLYAIVDVGVLGARRLEPIAFAQAVLCVRPAALQLRAKDASPRGALAILRALAPMCRRAGVPLVVNDHADLAASAGCDLVHVGQSDLSIDRVREIAPGIGVGVSTHTIAQLDEALRARPTYVAYGPVFETTTKERPDPVVGVCGLRAAHARAAAAGVPLVAIGGITRESARQVVGIAEAVAVISDLVPEGGAMGEVTARARTLHDLLSAAAPGASAGAAR